MAEGTFAPSRRYKVYLLALLLIICAFNYIDRLALGLVLQDVKVDLNLSDTQLGVLSGIAFALFYSVMGIPIARWADRGNRVAIIGICAVLWSIAVALCGLASSFLQLMLIRVVVAVGEAGCLPPAYSLIADYFTREERPRAAAIYGLGPPVASIVGYFSAGWLAELYGWRQMFLMLGAPGLLLGIVAWLTLIEPRLRRKTMHAGPAEKQDGVPSVVAARSSAGDRQATEHALPVFGVLRALWLNRTFRSLLLAFSVLYFFLYGILQWQPTFFARTHGLSSAQIGTWTSLALGVCGLVGALVGGELASRYAPADERRHLQGCAIAIGVAGLFSATVYLCATPYIAFVFIGLYSFMVGLVNGPLLSAIQTVVPAPMRAMAFAVIFLFANLIGMGFGPLSVGIMSDALRPSLGENSLRYALLMLAPGYLWSAWYLWRAGRTVAQDIESAASAPKEEASARVVTV